MPMFLPQIIAAIVMAVVSIALKVATGLITKALAKKKNKNNVRKANNSARENKQNITETTADLPVVYGRARLGCSRVFYGQKLAYAGETSTWESAGGESVEIKQDTRGEYLYLIAAFCVGEIDDIEQYYIDNVPITSTKFGNGYRNSVGFTWSFVEPSPITLITQQLAPIGEGGSNYYQLTRDGYYYDSTRRVMIKLINYQPLRYTLYRVINGAKLRVISFAGGTQTLILQNLPYRAGLQYVLEYSKDSGEIITVGNATFNITLDNADFVQTVNNNLTITQDSSLNSEYVYFDERRGLIDQAPSSAFLNQGVLAYNGNMRGNKVALAYFRFLIRTKGPDVDQSPFNGIPEIMADIRGRKIYDPRNGLTVYSNNPALCILDYLTDSLYYGCKIDIADIDLQSFIDSANHCDELITASNGATQIKRYVCNGVAQTANETLDNLIDLLECCNGWLYNDLGKWKLIIDKPETPSFSFDKNNMIGEVNINKSDFRSKINTIHARFINEKTSWETDVVTVKNDVFIQKDKGKILDTEIDLAFTNDYNHAYYLALLKLKSGRLDLTVTFTTFWDAFECLPGDVIEITREEFGFENKQFRVREIEPDNETGLLKFTVVEYDEDVYNNLNIDPEANNETTTLASPFDVKPPSNIQLRQNFGLDGLGNYYSEIIFEYTPSESINVRNYQVELKTFGWGDWRKLGTSQSNVFKTRDITPGKYEVRIKAINNIGAESEYAQEEIDIYAPTDRPSNVEGFQIGGSAREFVLTWLPVPEVKNNGFYIIRHSRKILNAEWNDIPTLEIVVPGYQTSTTISQIDGTYMIKALNSGGLQSSTEAKLSLDNQFDSEFVLVQTVEEQPLFNGEILQYPIEQTSLLKWNGDSLLWNTETLIWTEDIGINSMSKVNNSLQLAGTALWDSGSGLWDEQTGLWDDAGNKNVLIGVYNFANKLDFGSTYKVVLEKNIDGVLITSDNLSWDEQTGLWDESFGLWDGDNQSTVGANLFVRYTRDNPSLAPVWTEWQLLTKNELVCRAAEFKIEVLSSKTTDNLQIDELGVKVWMKNRIDQKKTLITSSNQLVSFNRSFYSQPDTVSISIDNADTGDYAVSSFITDSTFVCNVKDKNNLPANRQITATVYGLGEKL